MVTEYNFAYLERLSQSIERESNAKKALSWVTLAGLILQVCTCYYVDGSYVVFAFFYTNWGTLMTPVTPSLVYLPVSIASTSIHILLMQLAVRTVSSTSLLVIRVLHLMTQVCSIAHMFLSKWFVPLARTPSSLRSDSSLVMVLLLTHSLALLVVLPPVVSSRTTTVTTDVLLFPTSCDLFSRFSQRVLRDPLFLSKYK